ncbi:hypothetical protein [Tomitella biformata]|nr:hypothetical protein [Tomitella biformata]
MESVMELLGTLGSLDETTGLPDFEKIMGALASLSGLSSETTPAG